MDITLTNDQEKALKAIRHWYHSNLSQVFTLAGSAGTGKSLLISLLTKELGIEDDVVYCSLTGKAAQVLSKKGVNSCTIHHLIYDIDQSSQKLKFVKKKFLERPYKLIIVDEFSMVDKQIHQDLLSFNTKIIVVGDPFQLPPIGEEVGLLSCPDALLLEIVRQEEDSPIIKLATMIRNGGRLKEGNIGKEVVIVKKESIPDNVYLKADQIICGKNETRQRINNKVRELQGFHDQLPVIGDKLICMKNNWDCYIDGIPLINGAIGYCRRFKLTAEGYALLQFQPDYTSESKVLRVTTAPFLGRKSDPRQILDVFDFGSCITVHKSQGSEYGNVLFFNEWMPKETYQRWLYTAVTRAQKKIIIGV